VKPGNMGVLCLERWLTKEVSVEVVFDSTAGPLLPFDAGPGVVSGKGWTA
jgi:hypothetical protein